MKIWVDRDTGTWGSAHSLIFAEVPIDVDLDSFELMTDDQRVVFAEEHRVAGPTEPYCNHDAVAIHNGVCECGEDMTDLLIEKLDYLYQASALSKPQWLRARSKLYKNDGSS